MGGEGCQILLVLSDLDISFHFWQKVFCNLTPTQPHGVGELANMTFLCRSGHVHGILNKNILATCPHAPTPMEWRVGKDYFFVQIWTFHAILRKK